MRHVWIEFFVASSTHAGLTAEYQLAKTKNQVATGDGEDRCRNLNMARYQQTKLLIIWPCKINLNGLFLSFYMSTHGIEEVPPGVET
jgi:hypothetical protein